eukprot:TRINITY_DN867_c0_g1_i9.p1 TRINITY_DN867_c0_g1~~TRINITY_DN867_c0_g1_i9.p1  ORF type:complete len:555 (-),score=103.51 TRINITY_DN867_c0_g1_i9:38-1594(-)
MSKETFETIAIFTESSTYIKIEQEKKYEIKTTQGHSQLRDLLHFSPDEQWIYYCTSAEKPEKRRSILSLWSLPENVIHKVNRFTGETVVIENSKMKPIHCFTVRYGFLIVCDGSHMKAMTDDDYTLFFDEELNSKGDQINGCTLKIVNDKLLLFISRNGHCIPVYSFEKEKDKWQLKLYQEISIPYNINFCAFGSGSYSNYLMTCLDCFVSPFIGVLKDGKIVDSGIVLKVPWEKGESQKGEEGDRPEGESEEDSDTRKYSMMADWAPNSSLVALGLEEGMCCVFDLETREPVVTFHNAKRAEAGIYYEKGQIRTIRFSPVPSVPLLVFGEDREWIHFVDTVTWKHQVIKAPMDEMINGVKFSSDGRFLCVAFNSCIIEYQISVAVPSLKQICIKFLSRQNMDVSVLPLDLRQQILKEKQYHESAIKKPVETPEQEQSEKKGETQEEEHKQEQSEKKDETHNEEHKKEQSEKKDETHNEEHKQEQSEKKDETHNEEHKQEQSEKKQQIEQDESKDAQN